MSYVSIGSGFKLEPTTARQFMLMNYAFHQRFGVDIVVTWATRDSSEQIRLLNKYYRRVSYSTGKWWDGTWWAKRPGSTVTVATPGTSRHERGFALDVRSFEPSYNWDMAAWARSNAKLYGFTFNVSGEPWHIDRVSAMRITSGRLRALGEGSVAAPGQVSAPGGLTEEDDMTPAQEAKLDKAIALSESVLTELGKIKPSVGDTRLDTAKTIELLGPIHIATVGASSDLAKTKITTGEIKARQSGLSSMLAKIAAKLSVKL